MAIIMDDYPPRMGYGPPPQQFYSRNPPQGPPGPGRFGQHPLGFFAPAPLYPSFQHQQHQQAPRRAGVHKPRGGRGPHSNKPHNNNNNNRAGYGAPEANLSTMFAANKKKTRKHFHGPASTPRSVPPAPYNTNEFLTGNLGPQTPSTLGGDYHQVTPNPHGSVWKNTCQVDKDMLRCAKEVGLDLLGEGAHDVDIMASVGLALREFNDDDDDFGGSEDAEDHGTDHTDHEQASSTFAQLKRRYQAQSAYVADLEDRNLNLEEQLFVAQEELRQLRAAARPDAHHSSPTSPSHSNEDMEQDDDLQPHLEATAAPEAEAQDGALHTHQQADQAEAKQSPRLSPSIHQQPQGSNAPDED